MRIDEAVEAYNCNAMPSFLIDPQHEHHPRCPNCGYNMRALYDAANPRYLKCPECAQDTFSKDLPWARDREAHLRVRGLLRMGAHVVVRSLVGMIALGLLIATHDNGERSIGSQDATSSVLRGARLYVFMYGLIGISVGYAVGWNLEKLAGFKSRLLPVIAATGLCVTLLIAWLVFPLVFPMRIVSLETAFVITGSVGLAAVFVKHGTDIRWWKE